jgi:hypothetical protein
MTVDYRTYIRSDEWMLRRVAALQRTIVRTQYVPQPRCEVCGRPGRSHKNSRSSLDWKDRQFRVEYSLGLQVHHLHYRNLGQEEPEDLIVLCTDVLYADDYYRLTPEQRVGWTFMGRGCHSRVHNDPAFKREVQRIAGERW